MDLDQWDGQIGIKTTKEVEIDKLNDLEEQVTGISRNFLQGLFAAPTKYVAITSKIMGEKDLM